MKTNNNQPIKQDFFNQIANQFDTHVRQSIPLFAECIESIQRNIYRYHSDANILDICGSTGKFGSDLFNMRGFWGGYINIDGSPKMIEIANGLRSEFAHISTISERWKNILGGFMCGWRDEGCNVDIPQIYTNTSAFEDVDIIIESLGFQFFTKEREQQIREIKKIGKSSRICIFIEKFSNTDTELWQANEEIKDNLHKSKFFTAEEIAAKKENVLSEMGAYCYDYKQFEALLCGNFEYVFQIYRAGNFAGFVCSDKPFAWYFDESLINNEFNA